MCASCAKIHFLLLLECGGLISWLADYHWLNHNKIQIKYFVHRDLLSWNFPF